jgi:hypothetical protein
MGTAKGFGFSGIDAVVKTPAAERYSRHSALANHHGVASLVKGVETRSKEEKACTWVAPQSARITSKRGCITARCVTVWSAIACEPQWHARFMERLDHGAASVPANIL